MPIARIIFIVYRTVGGMVADVVAQCSCMNSPVTFVYPVGASAGSPYNIHILERNAGVLPFRNDGGFENNSDACLRSEVIANCTGDVGYVFSQQCAVT